ncbi:hypothetical protein C8A00DRAFT_14560 [Chaetomidium leptoderma]|uniref:Uncharacterized protein n=1 Tax=Chaetomidium leptoderma TaxID=669021 RepID=A0AAN6ZXY3_9PEZI|nr:hypothetical protein C8A00DRAFT_14560 [Chaetomidium leptoderma]
MPPSFSSAHRGPADSGAPGSLAWRRRKRRSRGLSPDSIRGASRSASPEDRSLNASQPAQSTVRSDSPDRFPKSATQPDPSKAKKSRSSKSKTKNRQALEAARSHPLGIDARLEEFRKRRRRSTAPSPFHLEDADQPLDESGPSIDAEDTAPPRDQSPKQTGFSKKDKGKGKEVISDVIPEEFAPIGGGSIFDFDDAPPPSAQPLGKRGRRNSDTKARKRRKTPQSSNAGSEGLLGQTVPEHINGDSRLGDDINTEQEDDVELPGATPPRPTVLDEDQPARATSPTQPKTSAAGFQRSHSDSGYAELDGQVPSGPKPGIMDIDTPDGLPSYEVNHHSAIGGGAGQEDNDSMSVMSEPHGLPVIPDSPFSLPASHAGDEEENSHTQERPPLQGNSEPASTPPESSTKSPGSRHSSKRKAKQPFFSRQEDENVAAFAELPPDDVASPPRPRRSKRARSPAQGEAGPSTAAPRVRRKKGKKQPVSATKSQYRSGPLSKNEQNQITRAVERFREDEDLTPEEINQVIHDNPQKSEQAVNRQLWASIQSACPSRSRKKLISWCRQRFHNFAGRGAWTQEQDDELADLIETHGKKWSYIAGLINRYQKDVRDRWRNYLVCREFVKTDVWPEDEEDRFRELVENAIEKIREGMSEGSRKPAEELINWLNISESMGYTRSRLQCMEKWKRMRAAEPLPDKVPTVLPPGSSWRLEKARQDLRRLTAGDKYALMSAIRDSGVGTDAKISWKPIVSGTFGGNYERQALVVTWGRLRKAVPDWEWKTTRDCARYLCEMYEREGDFGVVERGADGLPDDTPDSTNDHKGKGKEVARPSTADTSASASENHAPGDRQKSSDDTAVPTVATKRTKSASRQSRPKRGKIQSKTRIESTPSRTNPDTGEAADEEVMAEDDQAATESLASPAEKTPRQAERGQSPELDTGSPQPSPSLAAQASRTRRRERRGSTVERTSANGKEREIAPRAPKTTSAKASKRPRRGSLSNGNVKSPRPKKQKIWGTTSASKAKTNGVKAGNIGEDQNLKTGGRSWSEISSDMDEDMEDIPATLPTSRKAVH